MKRLWICLKNGIFPLKIVVDRAMTMAQVCQGHVRACRLKFINSTNLHLVVHTLSIYLVYTYIDWFCANVVHFHELQSFLRDGKFSIEN